MIVERCAECGAVLPEENGFSSLCERCGELPELEIVGGQDVVHVRRAPNKSASNEMALPAPKRAAPRVRKSPELTAKDNRFHKTLKSIKLDIDVAGASIDELVAYQHSLQASVIEISEMQAQLKSSRFTLGKESYEARDSQLRLEKTKRQTMLGKIGPIINQRRRKENIENDRRELERYSGLRIRKSMVFARAFLLVAKEKMPEKMYFEIRAEAEALFEAELDKLLLEQRERIVVD